MNNRDGYNNWAKTYDEVENKTRDIEAKALRATLFTVPFEKVLEIGCGTGKNTEWFAGRASSVTAVDFSENMMAKAKEKIKADNVHFLQADITKLWNAGNHFDLVACSLILEHIQDLHFVFQQAFQCLVPGGYFYIGELHPFKQYLGSKARFETKDGLVVLNCYIHHTSEYLDAAKESVFELVTLNEWFDPDNQEVPRLISLLFKKKK